jgi:Ca2+-dependent lipid-binding protein
MRTLITHLEVWCITNSMNRLLVNPEYIKADEQLSVELWDSDRNTADDIVGKVELSMQKMIQHPGKMYPHVSKLAGMEAGSEMPGELHWEVGTFILATPRIASHVDSSL